METRVRDRETEARRARGGGMVCDGNETTWTRLTSMRSECHVAETVPFRSEAPCVPTLQGIPNPLTVEPFDVVWRVLG